MMSPSGYATDSNAAQCTQNKANFVRQIVQSFSQPTGSALPHRSTIMSLRRLLHLCLGLNWMMSHIRVTIGKC